MKETIITIQIQNDERKREYVIKMQALGVHKTEKYVAKTDFQLAQYVGATALELAKGGAL